MKKTVYESFFLLFTIYLIFGLLIQSCNQTDVRKSLAESPKNTDQINIHLPAMYTGTLPCADCPGINYRLIIEEDQFVEISRYQDRSPRSFEKTGSWSVSGDTLTLIEPEDQNFQKRFLVDEQTLTLLNIDNQQINGELANRYVLERTGNQPSIREHHQKLADQEFKFFAGGNEPFWSLRIDSLNNLIFETPDSTVTFGKADSSKIGNRIVLKAVSKTGQITVHSNDIYCQDSMSGYLFPRTVSILFEPAIQDTLTGCGLFLNG